MSAARLRLLVAALCLLAAGLGFNAGWVAHAVRRPCPKLAAAENPCALDDLDCQVIESAYQNRKVR